MSHITECAAVIPDLDVLERACARLGYALVRDQQTYNWYGRFVGDSPLPAGYTVEEMGRCLHAVQVPGASYEIGVIARRDGLPGFALVYDFWPRGGLTQPRVEDLLQAITLENARRSFEHTHQLTEEALPNGDVLLWAER